jgi:fucose permease
MPFLTSRLLRQFQFRNGLLILALVALVPAALSTVAGESNFPPPHDAADLFELVRDYRLWLAILAFFFFFALETALLLWPSLYLADLGYEGKYRTALLVGFWLCFLATRCWAAQMGGYLAAIWWLLILTVVTAILIGNMSGIYHSASGSVCFLLLGGAVGPIFPTLVGLLFLIFADQPATAFGLVCALGAAGRLIAWPIIQAPLQRQQVRVAMWITTLIALLIGAPTLALVLSWAP